MVSGLSGRFSKHPQRTLALAKVLNENDIAFAIFDHRGQGTINFLRKKKRKSLLGGTAYERFGHCIYDIDAAIRFLRKKGYKRIFLLGHSTGANKIAYYYWKTKGRSVTGFVLLGPLSDIAAMQRKEELGKKYKAAVKRAEAMAKKGKGKSLLPHSLVGNAFWSAGRFLSITKEGGKEDTFPYYNPRRKFYWTKNVRVPVLVLIGGRDQFTDRPVAEIMEAFKKQVPARLFTGKIVKGANHEFSGKEKELAQTIAGWISAPAEYGK